MSERVKNPYTKAKECQAKQLLRRVEEKKMLKGEKKEKKRNTGTKRVNSNLILSNLVNHKQY